MPTQRGKSSGKSVIIIGAGLAGLSAGCYEQMNGYKTHIFEMHSIPGGLCTSWKRKGYTIDGCFEFLWGAGPGSRPASSPVSTDVTSRELMYSTR